MARPASRPGSQPASRPDSRPGLSLMAASYRVPAEHSPDPFSGDHVRKRHHQLRSVASDAEITHAVTITHPKSTRSATRSIRASRFELPLLGSNQDSPDPESGVLPVTPRGTANQTFTACRFGLARVNLYVVRSAWFSTALGQPRRRLTRHRGQPRTTHYVPASPLLSRRPTSVEVELRGLEPLTSWVRSRRSPS